MELAALCCRLCMRYWRFSSTCRGEALGLTGPRSHPTPHLPSPSPRGPEQANLQSEVDQPLPRAGGAVGGPGGWHWVMSAKGHEVSLQVMKVS